MPYGSWYNYALEMERAASDFPETIFTCYYEDMKKVVNYLHKNIMKTFSDTCDSHFFLI